MNDQQEFELKRISVAGRYNLALALVGFGTVMALSWMSNLSTGKLHWESAMEAWSVSMAAVMVIGVIYNLAMADGSRGNKEVFNHHMRRSGLMMFFLFPFFVGLSYLVE